MNRRWIALLAVTASLLVVAVLAGGCNRVSEYRSAQDSKSWPTTTGQIISATSSEVQDPDFYGSYAVHASYRYEVAGQSYTSDRVKFFSSALMNEQEAKGWLKAHPAGGDVTVYYDPDDPVVSVLEPGGYTDLETRLGIIFPAILIGILAVGLLMGWLISRSPSNRKA